MRSYTLMILSAAGEEQGLDCNHKMIEIRKSKPLDSEPVT